MKRKEIYLSVIDKYLTLLLVVNVTSDIISQVYFGTLTLLEKLYGKKDIRISNLAKYKTEQFDLHPYVATTFDSFKSSLTGVLRSIRCDIENDLIFSIEKQTIGSVVADFIVLAKNSIEENKDVAAVLASAALEDALRRYAILNELEVDDKDMAEVINSLKSKSLLKGPQASVVTSYTKTRNKAFHAEFNKIETPEVKSLIAFTEEFIIKNLS